MEKWQLVLYIAGYTAPSQQAIANLQRICDQILRGRCETSIVDVYAQPDVAEREHIIATPTLVRCYPLPRRRVIGDLSDIAKVITILGWTEQENT
ncbi:MAG: circadian clock KaiB family protein [Anaerolineae bacterium]|nr:circadian clock KaiB family protein [Anaerolineae bacterium]